MPTLPEAIAAAARDFAKLQRAEGKDLIDDWINNGPAQIGDVLPPGWHERIELLFKDEAITFSFGGEARHR